MPSQKHIAKPSPGEIWPTILPGVMAPRSMTGFALTQPPASFPENRHDGRDKQGGFNG